MYRLASRKDFWFDAAANEYKETLFAPALSNQSYVLQFVYMHARSNLEIPPTNTLSWNAVTSQ